MTNYVLTTLNAEQISKLRADFFAANGALANKLSPHEETLTQASEDPFVFHEDWTAQLEIEKNIAKKIITLRDEIASVLVEEAAIATKEMETALIHNLPQDIPNIQERLTRLNTNIKDLKSDAESIKKEITDATAKYQSKILTFLLSFTQNLESQIVLVQQHLRLP